MGGEWCFSIEPEPHAENFNLGSYRWELKELKEAAKEQNAFRSDQVEWVVDDEALVETNIFATFRYTCSRHNATHHGPEGPNWKLYWDPQLVPYDRVHDAHGLCHQASNTHARCAHPDLIRNYVLFQCRLARMFHNIFLWSLETARVATTPIPGNLIRRLTWANWHSVP
jgi:hypothetical protein